MEIPFIKGLESLDKLVFDGAPVGTIRNFISSLREQAEADEQRTAKLIAENQNLVAENQKVVAEKTALAQEIAKLKAPQQSDPIPRIKMNLGIGKIPPIT